MPNHHLFATEITMKIHHCRYVRLGIFQDRIYNLQGVVYHINLPVAHLCYYNWGKIQPTETILLHAAAGGIGTLLTQIAKRRANNVIIAL